MSDDLLERAHDLVARAHVDEGLEAFLTHERTFYVKAYMGEVEALSSSEPLGAGVRVVVDGRAGFAYTTDLSVDGLDEMVASARDNAAHATRDDAVVLPESSSEAGAPLDGLVDRAQSSVPPEAKASFAIDLERATAAHDRVRAVEEAVYSDSHTEIAIATSTGISGAYERTDAWCFSVAIAEDEHDTEVGFDFGLARGISDLDPEDVARRAAQRATDVLGARKIPSGKMPVIFDPYTSGQFLGVLGSALTGEAAQKGRSLFAGRIGDDVAGANVTLFDDGRLRDAPGSSPWDDEGVATRRTEIISGGVLRSFLYDTTSARREGRSSTGNASRHGFKSVPGPAPSNLAFENTGGSRADVLRRVDRGLLVQDFHGVHSGANPVSGDFSVGATGRSIANGELTQPVKEVTIALPMLEILRNVGAVADDRRWLPFGGSYGGATTLIAEMTVAGL